MNARSAARGTTERAHQYHISKELRAPRLSHAARRAQVRSGRAIASARPAPGPSAARRKVLGARDKLGASGSFCL
jgi:hypothetical protein